MGSTIRAATLYGNWTERTRVNPVYSKRRALGVLPTSGSTPIRLGVLFEQRLAVVARELACEATSEQPRLDHGEMEPEVPAHPITVSGEEEARDVEEAQARPAMDPFLVLRPVERVEQVRSTAA